MSRVFACCKLHVSAVGKGNAGNEGAVNSVEVVKIMRVVNTLKHMGPMGSVDVYVAVCGQAWRAVLDLRSTKIDVFSC